MQMSPRADSNSNSRALIVLEKKPEAIEEKKLSFSFSGEGELSDNQLPATLHNVTQHPRHKTETQPLALVLRDPRFPPPGDTSLATYGPAYPLTSYTGTGSSFDAEASKSGMVRSKPAGDASEDESTLIGSVMSRQVNDLQRINALKSQGIVVNDVDMVRKVPEVFGIASSEMEPADSGPLSVEKTSKPNVWDYLDEQGDSEQDSTTLNSRVGAKRDAEASKMSRNDICMHHSSRKPQTPPTPVEARAPDPPLIPFFHWDKNKTAGMGSDVMVRQVLDEVHHRLLENNDHWRVYKRGSEITLEDLQTSTIDSLYAPSSDNIRDSILDFRSKTSNTRKHGLFNAVKFLVKLFIPLNFEHDMTKKLWGAMNKICQTLDGILNSTSEDSFIAFQTQDYTDDRDLIECLRIPDLQRPMRNCARCQSRFMTLEEGLRHLDEEHFASNIGIDSEYSAETRQLYLRTAFQIETEARLNAFLSLIEGCTKAFMELGKNAEDMLVGTLRLGDHVETQGGYPIIESLVKVFEHFTIILVFSADFMAKADKTMRTDRQRALDCGKFAIKLRGSLNQIIRRAQKDLDQARRDIILASNTDYGTETLASIGPEFMIALVSNGLFFRRLENASGKSSGKDSSAPISDRDKTTIDASELYKRYANKLQLQVNQRPQKRLLPDIYALEEELEILQKVVHWQMKFCHDFYRVLDPESYRITTKTRLSHFNHERRYLHRTIDRLKVRSAEFTSLLVRSARLRDQLQQSIEIEEESHGNAIRVFTFVTLFFLPLSFVTSFFGMNTVDIRDSDQTQAIFWIASIPTTAVVLGLAYIYGYKWESWQDRRRSAGYARRIKERGNRALRSAAALADSAGLWGSSANDLEKGGMTRRETDMSVLSQNPVRKERGKHVRFWESRSDNDDNARL
ncbi:hypothetical protein F5Y18DRAFT_405661 [Xylariaceae sp. FL1019]|nr:hypothetical protein F5Y18DRAFT_405661 [Xylariaceae sp. FL1019]